MQGKCLPKRELLQILNSCRIDRLIWDKNGIKNWQTKPEYTQIKAELPKFINLNINSKSCHIDCKLGEGMITKIVTWLSHFNKRKVS